MHTKPIESGPSSLPCAISSPSASCIPVCLGPMLSGFITSSHAYPSSAHIGLSGPTPTWRTPPSFQPMPGMFLLAHSLSHLLILALYCHPWLTLSVVPEGVCCCHCLTPSHSFPVWITVSSPLPASSGSHSFIPLPTVYPVSLPSVSPVVLTTPPPHCLLQPSLSP